MANVQIPNLPAVASVSGDEVIEAVQAGTSVKVTLNQVASISGGGGANVQQLLDNISTTQGSLLYRGALEWTAIEPGISGRVLATNGPSANPSWIVPGGGGTTTGIIYVDKSGNDANDGLSASSPVLTIKRAAAIAQGGNAIMVNPGTYYEQWPIILKRNVSLIGNNLRSVNVAPVAGYAGSNIFLVDSGCYITGMTFIGHQAGSWAVSFNAAANNTAIGASGLGAYILKSPYIQNCTSYTAASGTGEAGSTSEGTTGGGLEVDGNKCAPNTPIRSMVVDSYTFVNLDGPGCLVTNDAYAQLVSCFGTFCSYHVKALNGGVVNLTNSTTDFGTQGLIANGKSPTALFSGTSGGAIVGANTINITALTPNRFGNSNMPNTGQIFAVGANYYTVTGAVPISGGYTVTFYPYLTTASTAGATISFYQRSQIASGGHTMEYVGAGTNYEALPWNGGIPIPANQIVEEGVGRVFFSTTDELGNFRVGEQFSVNGTTGEVTINTDSFNISGLNQVGPFSRDGGITAVGVALMEVSNNTALLASTGAHDGNTAPTQYAVYNYLLNNYTLTADLGSMALQNSYDVSITGGAISGITDLAVADGGTGSSTASGARTNLGLGTIATQNASNVSITGGAITGITDLAVADGGTGRSSYTIGDILYASASGVISSLADVATGNAIISGGVGVAPSYGKIGLTTHVSGALPVANGGTGATDAATARANLGITNPTLGTMASQDASAVAITGGTITGITDLAVADGGTGASTAAGARTNLGLGTIATQDAATVAITGGTINGTSVGATTRSTGAFTAFAVSSSVTEAVFAVTGTTPALNPANGTIQTWTLTANSTPTDSVAAGQSITLMVDDGTAYTITWPSVTWKTDTGSAPTLNTTGYTVIVLWKVGSVLYGARVGSA